MSQEKFEEIMVAVLEDMALTLLSMGMGLPLGEQCVKNFMTCNSPDMLHLRVQDGDRQTRLQVCGKSPDELGWQLVLACLQKISIDQLRAYHKQPLKRIFDVKKGNG